MSVCKFADVHVCLAGLWFFCWKLKLELITLLGKIPANLYSSVERIALPRRISPCIIFQINLSTVKQLTTTQRLRKPCMSFPLGQVVFRLVCFSVAYLFYLRYDFAVPTYFLLFRTCIIDNGRAEKRCWSRSCSAEERNSGILFERLFTSFFGMSRKLRKKGNCIEWYFYS